MRSRRETSRELEVRDRPGISFRPAIAGIYHPARVLAHDGNIESALNKAEEIYIENYGQMHGVTFRVVEKSTTIYQHGSWDSFQKDEP